MIPRSLTYAQKQKLTNALFWTCAAGAIFTVALPSFLPCPVIKTAKAGLVYAEDGTQIEPVAKHKRDSRQVLIAARKSESSEGINSDP